MMTTQGRRPRSAPDDEPDGPEVGQVPGAELVVPSALFAEDGWRQFLAQQLLERARAEGVRLVGPDGLLAGVTKAVLETALQAEMTEHLGYAHGDQAADPGSRNKRNGTTPKTVHTGVGPVEIDVPRDRDGSFDPTIVPKHARRVHGFNEAILSLYAKGLTTGEIQDHLAEVYGAEVSREFISKVTDAVSNELTIWRGRPLDRVYAVMFIERW